MAGETTPTSASAPAPDGWRLGHTSESYESGGRGPGTISSGHGDAGGQSYGNWQLSSNEGTLREYLRQSGYKDQFKGLELGSPDFNDKWREVAKTDLPGFQQDQYSFIKASHFDKQVERLRADGLDLSGRGPAVQDALWSSSVQYRGLTKGIFEKGLEEKFGKDYDLVKLSDKDIVTAVQDYKISHNETLMGRNSAAVRTSVKTRAENEKTDLLGLVDGKLVHHGGHAHKPASLTDKHHRGHALYEQALHKLQKWNHDHHIKVDPQNTRNAAAALAVESHLHGLTRIDLVAPNDRGDKLIAVQEPLGAAPSKVIGVDTVAALNTPMAQSSQAFTVVQQTQPQAPQQSNQQAPQQTAPAMSR